ncbi:hypothetical protein A8W25_01780 [Streptomyces sp. ERV7]|uniref:hypothetical protein n=1 Tax=Streptomyces sp. ERV7 TaxID=1322334 RepID=UPI0007F559AE|nr:hypothetical protein [Streptomyces sp. ERV7]OAR27034.1 hypothetical protein A8W25_01780 [Streptomyces sp. ERV7]
MSAVEVERARQGEGRRTLNSAMWALLIPGGMALGAGIGQYALWLGVILTLGLTAVAACLIGGAWHRAGAATLASVGCFALVLFAGPAMYEVYMKTAGDPVPAVVTQVVDEHNRRGADLVCTVAETGGDHTVHKVSQQQNCFGQAEVGDRVEIRKDPLGLLKPRLPDSPDQEDTTETTVDITLGLLLLTAATTFYAGQRRRAG